MTRNIRTQVNEALFDSSTKQNDLEHSNSYDRLEMKIEQASIESQYERLKKLRKEDVEKLREWAKLQPHFPHIEDYVLAMFLHACNYEMEPTKRCLEDFLVTRALTPEMFKECDPRSEALLKAAKATCIGVLPKLNKNGHGIFYIRLVNPDVMYFNEYCTITNNALDLHMRANGFLEGYDIVIDCEVFNAFQLLKIPISSVRKGMHFLQNCIPLRMKSIHLINSSTTLERFIAILKPLASSEFFNMIKVHKSSKTFADIPKELIPVESGGSLCTVAELQEQMHKMMMDNAEQLVQDAALIADMSRKPEKLKLDDSIFGMEGNFKQLAID